MFALVALLWLMPAEAADRMVRMVVFATSEPEYQAVDGCRLSSAVGNYGFALLEDSYSCQAESDGIHREQRFYATEFGIRMQYVHVWIPLPPAAMREHLQNALTSRFGPGKPVPSLWVAGAGLPAHGSLRWTTERGLLILHERAFHNGDGLRSGVHLFGISHDRWQMALDDIEPVAERAPDSPKFFQRTVAVLRRVARAPHEQRAELLVRADAMVDRLVGMRIDADEVREALGRFGMKIGAPTHYAGLEYWREPLWRAFRENPGTAGGSAAALRLLELGWPEGESTGTFCTRPDTFARVIGNGEAYLAKYPGTRYAAEIRFVLAEAYETWWSAVRAKKDESLVWEQFLPVRHLYVKGAPEALKKAIEYYAAVVQGDPGSRQARLAQRRLPRLRLGLDTGQRRFLCVMC